MSAPRTAGPAEPTKEPVETERDKVAKERKQEQDRADYLAMMNARRSSFSQYIFKRIDAIDADEAEAKKERTEGGIGVAAPTLLGEGVYRIYDDAGEQILGRTLYVANGAMSIVHHHKNEEDSIYSHVFNQKDADILIAAAIKAGKHVHTIGYGDPAPPNPPKDWKKVHSTVAEVSLERLAILVKAVEKTGGSLEFDADARSLLQHFGNKKLPKELEKYFEGATAKNVQEVFYERKMLLDANKQKNETLAGFRRDQNMVKHTTEISNQKKPSETIEQAIQGKTEDIKADVIAARLTDLEARKEKVVTALKELQRHVEGAENILDTLEKTPTAFFPTNVAKEKEVKREIGNVESAITGVRKFLNKDYKHPKELTIEEVYKHAEEVCNGVDQNFYHNKKVREDLIKTIETERAEILNEVSKCKEELEKLPSAVMSRDGNEKRQAAIKSTTNLKDAIETMKETLEKVNTKAQTIPDKSKSALMAIQQEKESTLNPGGGLTP